MRGRGWVAGMIVAGVVMGMGGCATEGTGTGEKASANAEGKEKEAQAEKIKVDMTFSEDGGTMHYAERLKLSLPGARSLVMKTDVEHGQLAPIVQMQFPLKDGRHLLLGWTSWGGGMQTEHALIVEKKGAVLRLVDELVVQHGRGSPRIVFRTAPEAPAIGVFEPKGDRALHDPWSWSLAYGNKQLSLEEMRKLRYTENVSGKTGYVYYAPPFFEKEIPGQRVAWFAITKGGFEEGGSEGEPKDGSR